MEQQLAPNVRMNRFDGSLSVADFLALESVNLNCAGIVLEKICLRCEFSSSGKLSGRRLKQL